MSLLPLKSTENVVNEGLFQFQDFILNLNLPLFVSPLALSFSLSLCLSLSLLFPSLSL